MKKDDGIVPAYDLGNILPDLNEMEVLPIDLVQDYWTPESAGETKRLFFKGIVKERKKDEETGEPYEAEVAYFIEQLADGSHKQITNQSVRMISSVKPLQPGTPIQVTYTGKKRTQSGHNIDTWHISPMVSRSEAYKKAPISDFDGQPDLEDIETLD